MPETVWRIVPGLTIDTLGSEQQLVVFNQLSGDTHLLNKPVDWVLAQIASRPASLPELIGLAIKADILPDAGDSRVALWNLLDELEKIDLVESGPFT